MPSQNSGLIHHSDRGGRYLSIRYIERPAEAGIDPSVGSVGGRCGNALAESATGYAILQEKENHFQAA